MRLFLLCLLKRWKENRRGKISIIQEPEENYLLCESKTGNTLLNLLSISIIESLIISCWWEKSKSNEKQWGLLQSDSLDSSNKYKMWLWISE